jgi:hypothetical protein
MNNQHCNIITNNNSTIENIKDSIERNNNKLVIYNKFMDELITNFHLLNLKFFSIEGQ